MSTPVMPIVPPAALSDAAEVDAPEKDSERAGKLARERDDALARGELPPPDIAGLAEQHRAQKAKG